MHLFKSVSSTALLTGLAVALGSANAYAQCDSGETVIKFSHVVAGPTPKGKAAQAFADRVNSELQGEVCVEVYPNTQLYNDDKVLQAMLLGDVQMAAPSLSKFEQYTLQYRIFDLPFLFDDIGAVDRFQLGDTGQAMLSAMEDEGLKGLGYWHNGMKQISAGKPLLEPADAEGLKFRIQESDVLQAQFRTLGANPQKWRSGGLPGSAAGRGRRPGEHFVQHPDAEVPRGAGGHHRDQPWGRRLPRGHQHRVLGRASGRRPQQARADLRRGDRRGQRQLGPAQSGSAGRDPASGEEIRELTPEQRQAWVDAMKPVWEEFAEEIGQENLDAAMASNTGS